MTTTTSVASPEFGPLDAALKAAAVRGDLDQERLLEQAIANLGTPPRHVTARKLQVALWYANRGMRVFPLKPGEKRPLERSHGVKDATTDYHQLVDWFEGQGDMLNVGIATGDRFDVIDIDPPNGPGTFIDMIGDTTADWLNIRAVAQTPRGLHLWVPAVEGASNIQNNGTGVDYRGKGGYVVVPPSHIDGTVYRWLLPPIV